LLVLNFFPAFVPPSSGGEMRYFNLYLNLSKYFDVTLLSPTYNDHDFQVIEHSQWFREYRVPKEDIHNKIHWELEKESFSKEFSALTCSYSSKYFNKYHDIYLNLYPSADIIIHEFPYMINYDLFFGVDNKIRIYNSHNFEYKMVRQIYKGPNAQKHIDYLFSLEEKLCKYSDLIFATSEEERFLFHLTYKVPLEKIKLAPNGINVEDLPVRLLNKVKNKTALFIGSYHPPNLEAVEFIINDLSKKCPDILFIIAGSCCLPFKGNNKNVLLLGKISEEKKKELLSTCDIAINPVFSGAGTNLKTLEFLACGIPLVSTDVGVRGLSVKDREHFCLANKQNFFRKIYDLINDPELKKRIACKGKEYILRNFTWETIADNIRDHINRIEKQESRILLLLNDFKASKPISGGEIRINKLYSNLSKYYKILFLCLTDSECLQKEYISDSFIELAIPKSKEQKKEENKINSLHPVSVNDIITSLTISKNVPFVKIFKVASSFCDAIIYSHPYMYNVSFDEELKNKKIIYEAHNCEYLLKKEILKGHPLFQKLTDYVRKIESILCDNSDFVVVVSEEDKRNFQKIYNVPKNKLKILPNGVEILTDKIYEESFVSIKSLFRNRPIIIFVGSSHFPNIEAAKFIIDKLARQCKDCYFVIVGSVCEALFQYDIPSNVLLFGKVEEEVKNVLLRIADIALNPMFSGSGSNLKLGEYFANKLPTITTPLGARGYQISNYKEAIICDFNLFTEKIYEILKRKELANILKENSFLYVKENLLWPKLAEKYKNFLDLLVKKKLLIVTYRFTEPPKGGAELYLYKVIEKLASFQRFDITVAFPCVKDIYNIYHFATKLTSNDQDANSFEIAKKVNIKIFSYDDLTDDEKFLNSKILMKNWLEETRLIARRFINKYSYSLLMGGWHFPELLSDGSYQLWTSGLSEIFISSGKKVTIVGYSPKEKKLKIKIDNKIEKDFFVKENFVISLFLSYKNTLLSLITDEESFGKDIRPLGVLIRNITIDDVPLSLTFDYRAYLKEHYLSQYIEALIDIVNKRDLSLEEIFQKTRGIMSESLERFLDKNIKNYDLILGHGIPFATPWIVYRHAKNNNVPYVLLPHFHFDDEFYHWKYYYDSLKNSKFVFAFPEISIPLFFNKLKVNAKYVPGGGIELNEFTDVSSRKFLNLYNSDKPFFLVLGRKTPSKQYQLVIRAIEEINKNSHICNLVMIGKDEDHIPINSKFVKYLGEQPREIVLGALKEMYALINMSKSESFGIVILESWAFKKPVIVNETCPAFRDLVQNEVNGFIVNENNLSEKLLFLLRNPDLAKTLGFNGYKEIFRFTWYEIAKKIQKYLLQCV